MTEPHQTIFDLEFVAYGERRLCLDLYLPQSATAPLPTIMYIPVGGWRASRRPELRGQFEQMGFTEHGFALAVIEARVHPEAIAPATVFDCKAGIRWLRNHAAEYGLDPDRIGTCGRSAGGHLSALMAVSGDVPELEGDDAPYGVSTKIQACVDQCGPSDLERMADAELCAQAPTLEEVTSNFVGGPVGQNRDLARLVSPLRHVSAACPPMLIIHGEKDATVPLEESVIFHDALVAAGVDSTLDILPGVEHGWDAALTYDRIVDFFRRTL